MHTNTYPSQTADKYMLRLPDGWRAIIKEHAARNRRSMNSEIISRLEKTLETENTNA